MPTHAFQLGLELRQVLQQRAACLNALADRGCTLAQVARFGFRGVPASEAPPSWRSA
jgi:hypothetical protein